MLAAGARIVHPCPARRRHDRAESPLDQVEHAFDDGGMFEVAAQRSGGALLGAVRPATEFAGHRVAPPLPVHPALSPILPDGLRRGSTVAVTGSVSLLLALLGAASADGAWCALVGLPRISAEAALGYGLELSRLAVVVPPERGAEAGWTTAVGALLDAVDVVAARVPGRIAPGEVRRLDARARGRDAVLVAYGNWPGADLRLNLEAGTWTGIGAGTGRLRARRVRVVAEGRGRAARPRSAELLLPAADGRVFPAAHRSAGRPAVTGGESLLRPAAG